MTAIFLAASLLFLSSCKKNEIEAAAPAALPETAQQQGIFEEDHITMTPERQRQVDEFNRYLENNRAIVLYRGFRVNWGANVPADIQALVKADIDRIFTSGVTNTTITRMQGAIINVFDGGAGGNLFYTNGQVYITSYPAYRSTQAQSPKGPVIFHELIHYYHDRILSGGFNNATVNNLYTSAYNRPAYSRSDYVLRNRIEYLATSAEAYFPTTFRVPFNPTYLNQRDPNCGNFLRTTF